MTRSVVVVGGGIAGLAVAHDLVGAGHDVVVLEADERAGGRLRTSPVGGLMIDTGPDAYLERVPGARELVAELGLAAQVVHPAATRARIHLDERLVDVPTENVLGVPLDLDAVAAAGVLTSGAIDLARRDLSARWNAIDGDCSVGALVRARLGDELFERLVDPLLSGINAGRADDLSVELGAPQLAAAARVGGSFIGALRQQRANAAPVPHAFSSLRGGVQVLADALIARLDDRVRCAHAVDAIVPGPHRTWRVLAGDRSFDAEHVVVATPAPVAARQLVAVEPIAARLGSLRFASVTMLTLVYPPGSLPPSLRGVSGVLVPRGSHRLLTACSFGSEKWPHWAPKGEVVVRASVGRIDDRRQLAIDDGALARRVRDEIEAVTGMGGEPLAVRVTRWPDSLAQLPPGHGGWLGELDRTLARHPGLHLVGASYEGVGIPATIRRSRRVVTRFS